MIASTALVSGFALLYPEPGAVADRVRGALAARMTARPAGQGA